MGTPTVVEIGFHEVKKFFSSSCWQASTIEIPEDSSVDLTTGAGPATVGPVREKEIANQGVTSSESS